jgi:hypothetical protein
VECFVKLIQAVMEEYSEVIPDDVELMVHVTWDEDEDEDKTLRRVCYYYLVHPGKRTIFWLNAFDAAAHLIELDGVNEPSHLSQLIWFS